MHRRTLLVTIVVGGLLTAAVGFGQPVATAAPTPMTGDVSCTLAADSTFKPPLGYARGLVGRRYGPHADAKWKVVGELTGCTGTQAGGQARRPGPIARGELLLRAKGIEHSCDSISAHGMTVLSMRIKWFDALGNPMLPTKATGTVTVDGLRNGSPYLALGSPEMHPGYVHPGVFSFNVTGTAGLTSKAFAGEPITMTAVADRTISTFQGQCSFSYPPVSLGIPALSFSGVNGPSSISIG